jgi:hypothetical protein
VIVLHSIPGVVLYDYLLKHFSGRYIFDYRDSTYEPLLGVFKRAVGNLIRKSTVTFTSSDGFRIYFPADTQSNVITSHNLLEDSLSHRNYTKTPSAKIRVAFWGFIRHEEINLEIIRKFSVDNRFELHYYGREQQVAKNLKKYVIENGIKNVFFHGEYKPEDRYDFIKTTDIIHNIYKDSNMMLAMGNKYYDGAIFRIPQICMEGSFMGETVTEHNIGLECDPFNNNFTDKIYDYYNSLDHKKFVQSCDEEVERFMEEYEYGRKIIKNI